jgi:hypothetical protein
VSTVLHAGGDEARTLEALERACTLERELVEAHPDSGEYRNHLSMTLNNRALTLLALRRPEEARLTAREAVAHQKRAFEAAPKLSAYRSALSRRYLMLGEVERGTGHLEEAVQAELERQKLWPGSSAEAYRGAVEVARAAAEVGKGKAQRSAGEEKQRAGYCDLAMDLLRRSVEWGFRDVARLEREGALGLVRGRDDYRKLVEGLRK